MVRPDLGCRIEPTDEDRVIACRIECELVRHRLVVNALGRLVRRDASPRDFDVNQDLRPERLREQHAATQPRAAAPGERGIVELLRPDADRDTSADVAGECRSRRGHLLRNGEVLILDARDEIAVGAVDRRLDDVHRRAADEACDEQVLRVAVELLRRVDLLQLTLAHDGDAITHRHRLGLVVRDVDRRRPELALDAPDLRTHLDAKLRVEVRERLVHQEDLRLTHDRATHRDALTLAARKLLRAPVEILSQAEQLRRPRDAFLDDVLGRLAQPQAERDVLRDVEMRIEGVILEHHRDVAVFRRERVDDAVSDRDRAVGDLLEPCHHAQRRRLAAARGPDEDQELAVLNLQREVEHRLHAVVVDLVDVFELDLSH